MLPRSTLADFVAAQDRPDPVALLESQADSRITDLVPVRYGRMLASPFAFFRGAALMATPIVLLRIKVRPYFRQA